MNLTLQLLRAIKRPSERLDDLAQGNQFLSNLYECSVRNRMAFFFLESIRKGQGLGTLETTYKNEKVRYLETLDAISRVSFLLTEKNIEHAVFKTIRPYTSTTVDIDTIIFGGQKEHVKAIKTMREAGYRLIVRGPRSTTLWDLQANIGIDLYDQVAVSFITYIDKEKLADSVIEMKQSNGASVKILEPEADLVCIVAHSIIKEQMYTLSEYYTFINYLKQMNADRLVLMAKRNNVVSAMKTHASITALLHENAFGNVPAKLETILGQIGQETFETSLITQNRFKIPHKYHPITVVRSLREIAKGKKSRDSMGTQLIEMMNPDFTRKMVAALLDHVIRRTY